jgi:hypothetical protein
MILHNRLFVYRQMSSMYVDIVGVIAYPVCAARLWYPNTVERGKFICSSSRLCMHACMHVCVCVVVVGGGGVKGRTKESRAQGE